MPTTAKTSTPAEIDITSVLTEAETRCKARGARLTEKRKQVLSGLLHSSTALSAYELVDYCRDTYEYSIPPMSVYRILDFLAEQHLVHRLNLANKYIACAHISCEHDHGVPQFLICGQCQRVEEVSIDTSTMTALQTSVENSGFQLASPQLEMDCLCNDCAKEKGRD
ncbi:Fur family transcriptional regulator [Halioglobus sp. HI00S01]|uniref:Fur family transcriptional regulator n=1 Tax=Halioglobus sp. HI00S01 TaxID=1822214 RepID=UPI0007C31676|nr:Fur family transcriptional regulator [Halioglobus sp. HI00S01]KZX58741.1 Fur family transcriptional regulator [Halioglobus sp. HI00S01]